MAQPPTGPAPAHRSCSAVTSPASTFCGGRHILKYRIHEVCHEYPGIVAHASAWHQCCCDAHGDSLVAWCEQARDLADKALASFVIIQAALKRSRRLHVYSLREDLNKRMPNFQVHVQQFQPQVDPGSSIWSMGSAGTTACKPLPLEGACSLVPDIYWVQVRMGFGLHVGWAIEGAIGSEYKIDASYLSPNVNMASRLEAATKQFGTSILMSEDFARMLSPQVLAPGCPAAAPAFLSCLPFILL